jgi:hypothetical protein
MIKMRNVAVYAAIVLTVTSSYFFFNSSATISNDGVEDVDFSTLSEVDIDIIVAVKERMKEVVPSAYAAE